MRDKLEKIIKAYEELEKKLSDPAVASDIKEFTRLNGSRGGLNAALGLSLGNALDAVHAGLELHNGVDAVALDLELNGLKATGLCAPPRATICHSKGKA